ncbi:MAG: Flp pilus assembly protein CpaB [Clostridiales bacterium]|nr:Flp pilus assembly protein CpaB [Clostridiales bacterium]
MKKVYIIAAIFAILTAFSIYQFASYLEDKSLPENVERVNVAVAATNIDKNTIITAEMVKTISLPKESVMSGTTAAAAELVGRLAVESFVANEQILTSRTAAQGERTQNHLAYELKKGEYAVTLDVSVITGTAGYIKEGDNVTLTMVKEKGDGTSDVTVLYKNVPVIRVSESYSRDSLEYKTLTLVMPEKDIFQFIKYQESGVIRPVLESAFASADKDAAKGGKKE